MPPAGRFLTTVRGLMSLVLACVCLCSVALLLSQVSWTRTADSAWLDRLLSLVNWQRRTNCRRYCQSNIRQIPLALIQYEQHYGSFPPAYVADEDGKPLYSWRVLILPYVDANDLYNAFNFRQPWDGPDNLWISSTNISVFCCPEARDFAKWPAATNYVAITGPGTLFPPGGAKMTAAGVTDGNNTILLAEVADSTIRWAEPKDLDTATMSFKVNDPARPSISSHQHETLPGVVLLDGSTKRLKPSITPAAVRSLITINGGETINLGQVAY